MYNTYSLGTFLRVNIIFIHHFIPNTSPKIDVVEFKETIKNKSLSPMSVLIIHRINFVLCRLNCDLQFMIIHYYIQQFDHCTWEIVMTI